VDRQYRQAVRPRLTPERRPSYLGGRVRSRQRDGSRGRGGGHARPTTREGPWLRGQAGRHDLGFRWDPWMRRGPGSDAPGPFFRASSRRPPTASRPREGRQRGSSGVGSENSRFRHRACEGPGRDDPPRALHLRAAIAPPSWGSPCTQGIGRGGRGVKSRTRGDPCRGAETGALRSPPRSPLRDQTGPWARSSRDWADRRCWDWPGSRRPSGSTPATGAAG
jgi:hypothetical protein